MPLSINECKDGYLYRLNARNLSYGIYRAEYNDFVGIRQKFGQEYLDSEYHYEKITGGVSSARPIKELEKAPIWNLTKYYNTSLDKATCPYEAVLSYLYEAPYRFYDEPVTE